MGLVRRLYFGSKTLFRAALLLPILAFMVIFSYNVDCSGLFQGALAPRRIVDLMLQGYDVTNYDQMDERQVVQLYAQDVAEAPEVIGIGSSRVLTVQSGADRQRQLLQHGRHRRRCDGTA